LTILASLDVVAADPASKSVFIPGTGHEVLFPSSREAATSSVPDAKLVESLSSWLSASFGLPPMNGPPKITFAKPEAMAALRYGKIFAGGGAGALSGVDSSYPPPDIVAFYDSRGGTIYLPEGWSVEPAALSVLVHELVHHLQEQAHLRYPCPEAREQPAFTAQAAWLGLFGSSLEAEFGIDRMTLLLRTNCMN
jgi:hypothetical protein